MKDFLIVGQGVAGSFLAWELLKRNQRITIVDDDHKQSSSIISAGIINPVTGKRFVVTPKFDQFYDTALKTYQALEGRFDQQFFEPLNMLRIFQDQNERDYWDKRFKQNDVKKYSDVLNLPGALSDSIHDPFGSVVMNKTGFCHTIRLLTTLKTYFHDQDILALQKVNYDDLAIKDGGVSFAGESYRCVIFCEGYQAQWNPWFNWIPYNSVKGEILKITMQTNLPRMIINKGKWCAPQIDDQWAAGSSYIWDQLDCEPTSDARTQIENGLKTCLKNSFSVTDHRAGVRPVIKDQNVVMGRHPQHNQLAIFNGLGSKGFLMAPYYAAHLAEHFCEQRALSQEISIQRFKQESSAHGG